MTDIRAALGALDALILAMKVEPLFHPDDRIVAMNGTIREPRTMADAAEAVRERLIHRALDARAALAAASPEPERCATCGMPTVMGQGLIVVDGKTQHQTCYMGHPAPAAPTAEALRDALVDDIRRELRRKGLVPAMTTTLRDRLIELEAAARADERTRLESLTVEAGPEPKHMPVICCRWHALAQANP